MTEESKQKISQLVDGSLNTDEALGLLQEMHRNPELVDKYHRYQAIGHALKNDVFLSVSSAFSARVMQHIEASEPASIARRPNSNFFRLYQKPCALAASMAIISSLVYWRTPNTAPFVPLLSGQLLLSIAPPQQKSAPSSPALPAKADPQQPVISPRIYQYLQAHNSSIYSTYQAEPNQLGQVAYSHKK